jgi:hypothetical protein
MHGEGILYYSNKDKYKGKFINGLKNGFGIMEYKNNDKYEGLWENDTC